MSLSTFFLKGSRLRRFGIVLFLVACILWIFEMVAGSVLAKIPKPSSYTSPRNPHFIRDWPAYTEPMPGPKRAFRVIVITNSQGFLRERKEGELSYPAMMEGMLQEQGYGVDAEVLNWSVPGPVPQELIVLAARAVAHQPDVVFLVSFNNNFSQGWGKRRLSAGHSDIVNLAYRRDVREHLPQRFLSRSKAYEPLGWLAAHSNLIACRNRFLDRTEKWNFISHEPGPLTKLHMFELVFPMATELMEDFFAALMSGEALPKVIVVSMPLNPVQFKNFEKVEAFYETAKKVAASWIGAEVLDATNLFPPSLFYGGRHMKPEAHKKFAQYLIQHIPPAAGS